jgi:type IV pilus assembly protein PilA
MNSMRYSQKKGFTLIELLIVVVIIGILAAIAIPKFASTKQKAYTASMKTDLRNLVTAEEAYFSDNTTYAGATASLSTSFHVSAGNAVAFVSNSGTGWSATATNTFVPATASGHICGVWVGGAASKPSGISADSIEGAPGCS